MNRVLKIILPIIFTLILFTSCQSQEKIVSGKKFALDTIIEIKLYYDDSNLAHESLIDETFLLIAELENILSVHIEGSDLYNIKENAGIEPVKVNEITYNIINESIKYSQATDGLFDVTAGPLIDLWAIDPPNGHVPTALELADVLPLIDYTKIEFSENSQIYLKNSGMNMNLGAIAKGAIADQVKDFLVNSDVQSAFINIGGNVLLVGSKLDGSDFSIGVQNPFDDRGTYVIAIAASNVAVVSSGDYERYFVYEDKAYHHILNTKTGYPAETNIKQVTIVAPNSQMADALSTSVLLLGLKDGIALVNSYDGVEAIFITKDKKIYITEALRDKIIIDPDESLDFTIIEDTTKLYN